MLGDASLHPSNQLIPNRSFEDNKNQSRISRVLPMNLLHVGIQFAEPVKLLVGWLHASREDMPR